MHGLKVSLEDLYNGVTKKLSLAKNVLCPKCDGKGSKSGVGSLRDVQGERRPRRRSSDCAGNGAADADGVQRVPRQRTGHLGEDKCPQCHGQKVVQEKKVLEVHIDKGMVNNQKIVFQGEADEAPGTVPGDIVFVVQEKEHPTFKRKGTDLFLEKDITLVEALCGFR